MRPEAPVKIKELHFQFVNFLAKIFVTLSCSSLSIKKHRTVICGNSDDDDVTRIKSGEWKMFYKSCG